MTSKDNKIQPEGQQEKGTQCSGDENANKDNYGEILQEKLKNKKPIPDLRIDIFPEIKIGGVKGSEEEKKDKT